MKRFISLTITLLIILQTIAIQPVNAQEMPVRLRDIGKIIEDRDNQLIGYGIVVGLRNTGDSRNAGLTGRALGNLLGKLGVPVGERGFNTRNVASVMVTATLPPFLKPGQKIPVVVSAMGDSTSLVGGTLLMTPLKGPDMRTYAVAQGSVLVGGLAEQSSQSRFLKNQTTVGRIPEGGIIEAEVPVTFQDQHHITIVLNESNFITVSRATEAIRESGFPGAQAIDANTVKVPLADLDSSDLIQTIARLEDVPVVPDSSAKVVINSRTGTVVIGERVRLFPVAMTHGNISVRITENAGGINLANEEEGAEDIEVTEGANKIVLLNPTATLTSLVNALNEIGATPKDLISIIQGLKQSGSLVAKVEIL
jgi:flagellar P-ring protein precursor FlgI